MPETDAAKIIAALISKGIVVRPDATNKVAELCKYDIEKFAGWLERKDVKAVDAAVINDFLSGANSFARNGIGYTDYTDKLMITATQSDWIKHFNSRHEKISKIIRSKVQRPFRISDIKYAERHVDLVAMVYDTTVSKKGHLLWALEDPSGSCRAIIMKDKTDLVESTRGILPDAIIGVSGARSTTGDTVFVDEIALPEVTHVNWPSGSNGKMAFMSDTQVGCLKGGSLVGLGRPIKTCKKGDAVLSSSETTIKEVVKRSARHSEEIITIKPMSILPVELTENHPVLIAKNDSISGNSARAAPREKDLKFVPAREVNNGDWVVMPRLKQSREKSVIRLHKQKPESVTELPITPAVARFLGQYVARGWVRRSRKNHSKKGGHTPSFICVAFDAKGRAGKKELEWYRKFVKRTFNRKCITDKRGGAITATFGFRPLARFLLDKVGKKENKRLPEELFYCDNKTAMSFIGGYDSMGDRTLRGCDAKTYVMPAVSKLIAYQVPLLTAKAGLIPDVRPAKRGGKQGAFPDNGAREQSGAYDIELRVGKGRRKYPVDNKYVYLPVEEVCSEILKEDVYNIETEDNTFACPIVVHNSKYAALDAFEEAIREINQIKNLRAVVHLGDLCDSLAVYPGHDEELVMKSFKEQYDTAATILSKVRSDAPIFIIPGNHSFGGGSNKMPSPSTPRTPDTEALFQLPNVKMLSDPSELLVDGKIRVLLTHGISVNAILAEFGLSPTSDSVLHAMKTMLKHRHLSPIYGVRQSQIMPTHEDYLVIENVPHALALGHIHVAGIGEYRGARLLSVGGMQQETPYMKGLNVKVSPPSYTLLDLATGMAEVTYL
jgi:DNA polymerase II small subunit/DNA polymerase delta subunit B